MSNKAWEIRQKFKKKKEKEGFKKICHLCNKELIITQDDIIFMIDNKSVHYKCWRDKTK